VGKDAPWGKVIGDPVRAERAEEKCEAVSARPFIPAFARTSGTKIGRYNA
jgi:hypothetical protein